MKFDFHMFLMQLEVHHRVWNRCHDFNVNCHETCTLVSAHGAHRTAMKLAPKKYILLGWSFGPDFVDCSSWSKVSLERYLIINSLCSWSQIVPSIKASRYRKRCIALGDIKSLWMNREVWFSFPRKASWLINRSLIFADSQSHWPGLQYCACKSCAVDPGPGLVLLH